jgi:hypothetical protein
VKSLGVNWDFFFWLNAASQNSKVGAA